MKKVFLTLIAVAAILQTGCSQTTAQSADAKATAVITFTETEHDFGTIEQGSDATFAFEFKNTGKGDLIVSNCQSTCGCTIPLWTKEPVAKNKKGEVKVKYNTNNLGSFGKSITVTCNATNSPVIIKIKGTVQPKAAEAQPEKK